MAVKDQVHNVDPEVAISPQLIDTDTTTNGADHHPHGDYQSLWFLALVGSHSDGDYEFKIEHADDDGNGNPDTWEDAPNDDIQNGDNAVTISTNGFVKLGYRGIKPHVRLVCTSSNTSAGANVAAAVMRGHAREAPFTAQAVT